MPTDFSPAATLLRSPWIPLAFGTATVSTIAANGFVAAFVAGILYRLMRTRGTVEHTIPHTEVMLVEEVGTLAANARRSDSSAHAAPRRSCSGCSPSQSCRSPRRTTCSP